MVKARGTAGELEMQWMKWSVRDLLWLTTLAAVLLGWYLHSRSWNQFHNLHTKYLSESCYYLYDEKVALVNAKGRLETENSEMKTAIEGKDAMLRRLLEKEHKAIQERKE